MRQVGRFVKCLMPLILLALRLIVTTVCLADHLHAREDFPWREQQFLEHFRITLLVVIGDGCVVQQSGHVVLYFVQGLSDDVGDRGDEGINLTMGTLANFQENDGASADDLVDDQG